MSELGRLVAEHAMAVAAPTEGTNAVSIPSRRRRVHLAPLGAHVGAASAFRISELPIAKLARPSPVLAGLIEGLGVQAQSRLLAGLARPSPVFKGFAGPSPLAGLIGAQVGSRITAQVGSRLLADLARSSPVFAGLAEALALGLEAEVFVPGSTLGTRVPGVQIPIGQLALRAMLASIGFCLLFAYWKEHQDTPAEVILNILFALMAWYQFDGAIWEKLSK
jgi:hypothetical protein